MYLAAWLKKFHETKSIGTNTENNNSVLRKWPTADKQKTLPDVQLPFIEITTRLKSIIGFVLVIIVRLVKITIWVVKITISLKNLKRLVKLYYFIHSQKMRNIIETVVDYANTIVENNIYINLERDSTNFSLIAPYPKQNSQRINRPMLCNQ
jgi:hypothetical protein